MKLGALQVQQGHCGFIYVKFIGTHAEYDKVDAAFIDQFSGE